MMSVPMPDRDNALFSSYDLQEALTLLTRLPMPSLRKSRAARAAWAYPLAGFAIGFLAAMVAWLAGSLPPALTAGFALLTVVAITGALHEDGLADSVDGLWGGRTSEQRLTIMADSRVGVYGVVAVVFSIGMRWCALAAIATEGALWVPLIAAAVLSRAPMIVLMHMLQNARSTGLSSTVGRPPQNTTLLSLAVAAGLGILTLGFTLVPVALLLCATTFVIATISKAKIGGQSGDVLGATQQISEITVLIILAMA